ncbi:MAG: endonuclease/exonuclease/phosphatase family protein [Flavobacteriales bacterium]|jgi:hypothetical protein|nr:endonuclease/exonuclease/phosphatase family protein [Flavobacteriales bacterium]
MNKKLIPYLLILLIFTSISAVKGQEVLKIMYYNLLTFPQTQPDRIDTLKKITNYIQPDVFVVNELNSFSGGVQILNNALNVGGIQYYSSAVFYDGPDTDNLLFYNSNKLGLVSQFQIPTALRDISEYVLYYKDPNLSITLDTTYLYFYSVHLKAGSQQSEMALRYIEAQEFNSYLVSNNRTTNLFVGGDFNIYDNSEQACQEILNGGNVTLVDPVNKMGSWHNNIGYQSYHTQSTRSNTGGYGGGSSGGMDDRFDFIFVSPDVMSGSSGVEYVDNSYKAIGQDGQHFNGDINIPINNAVPADIASALFYMSDHLPVRMEVSIGGDVGISSYVEVINRVFVNNDNNLIVYLKDGVVCDNLTIYDISGKKISNNIFKKKNYINHNLSSLSNGVYIGSLLIHGNYVNFKFLKSN